jgi:hypothetical protein
MQYAGTISVESATFEALLTDICRSYKAHGFMDIILLGDSGGNQEGMERVARSASAEKHHCQQGSEFPKADTQPGVAPIPSVDMQSRRIEPTVGSSPVRQLRKSMEEHNAGSHLRAEACLQHMHHQAVPVVHETRTDTGRENRRIYGPI